MINGYPKVMHLGSQGIENLFKGSVYVQEKVDGSQGSFRLDPDTDMLEFRSKRVAIANDDDDNNFGAWVNAITELKDEIIPGYTYRGEVLRSPKHNTLCYERAPKHHFIVFDIQPNPYNWFTPEDVQEECDRLGLEMVPWEKRDDITTVDDVMHMLDNISVLGKSKIEGMVFKNYEQYNTRLLDWPSFGKFVRPEFREMNDKSHKLKNPGKRDAIAIIIANLKTDARWLKGIQRMRDDGTITLEPRDIPVIMKDIKEDIEAEEKENVKEMLWTAFWGQISRGSVGGFAEFYKAYLLERQFEKQNEAEA